MSEQFLDTQRLDWLIENPGKIHRITKTCWIVTGGYLDDSEFSSPREAIDAAMKVEDE